MREIVPGVWTWSVLNEARGMNFNGWYVRKGEEAVIIDPPPPPDELLHAVEKWRRPVAILLTNKHHTRASEEIRRELACPLWVPEDDKPLMEISADRTYRNGDNLPCDLKAITVRDNKTPGESAFLYQGPVRALIVGDAVLGSPAGSLSMLPPEKFKNIDKARAGLSAFLEHDFEALLLGDGEPIVKGGRKTLEAFVTST